MLLKVRNPWLVLAVLAALTAAARLHTYDEPRSFDVTYFSVVGHGLLHGRSLYSDFWDHKPPAPYLTYAAMELLAGYGRLQIYLLGVIAAIAGLYGVYAATLALTNSTNAALWSAAFWTLVSSSLQLGANEPNCEVFINACIIWAFALIASGSKQPLSIRKSLAIGALLTLATLYKPFCIVNAVLFAVVHVVFSFQGGRKRALRDVGIWAGVGASVWFPLVGYFAATSRWQIFYVSNVTYNHFYSPHPFLQMLDAMPYFTFPIVTNLRHYSPLILLIVAGILAGIGRTENREKWLLLAFAVATYAGVAIPGKWFPHYFQLWLPLMAVAGGWAMVKYSENWQHRFSPLPRAEIVAALALALLLMFDLPYYRLDPLESSREIDQNKIVDTYELAQQLNGWLLPKENLVQFGDDPGFYFFCQRSSPTGLLFASHLVGPLADTLRERFIADVHRTKPELLVLDTTDTEFIKDDDLRFLLTQEYVPIGKDYQWRHFELRMRSGGALEARLHAGMVARLN
jgi:hypothetical protein